MRLSNDDLDFLLHLLEREIGDELEEVDTEETVLSMVTLANKIHEHLGHKERWVVHPKYMRWELMEL